MHGKPSLRFLKWCDAHQVVLLRSGVLLHVKKYMQTLGLLPLDPPVQPEAQQDAEEAPAEGEDQSGEAGMLQTSESDQIICRLFQPQWMDYLEDTSHADLMTWHRHHRSA